MKLRYVDQLSVNQKPYNLEQQRQQYLNFDPEKNEIKIPLINFSQDLGSEI